MDIVMFIYKNGICVDGVDITEVYYSRNFDSIIKERGFDPENVDIYIDYIPYYT